jgi:hypothetical protein
MGLDFRCDSGDEHKLVLHQGAAIKRGAPAISDAVLDQICACGAFVSDLTLEAKYKNDTHGEKWQPNGNVLIETGCAAGTGKKGADDLSDEQVLRKSRRSALRLEAPGMQSPIQPFERNREQESHAREREVLSDQEPRYGDQADLS